MGAFRRANGTDISGLMRVVVSDRPCAGPVFVHRRTCEGRLENQGKSEAQTSCDVVAQARSVWVRGALHFDHSDTVSNA